MLDSILLYLAKWAAEYAIAWLTKKLGHEDTAVHIQQVLSKYTPLPDDPLPSPASLRKPPQYKG